jgi:hypothetical protein
MSYETKYEKRPGQGSAFANKDKKEDWHADFKGDVLLPDGTLHWLEVMPATTRAGEPYFKVKIGNVKVPRAGMTAHSEAKSNGYQPLGQAMKFPDANPDADIPF